MGNKVGTNIIIRDNGKSYYIPSSSVVGYGDPAPSQGIFHFTASANIDGTLTTAHSANLHLLKVRSGFNVEGKTGVSASAEINPGLTSINSASYVVINNPRGINYSWTFVSASMTSASFYPGPTTEASWRHEVVIDNNESSSSIAKKIYSSSLHYTYTPASASITFKTSGSLGSTFVLSSADRFGNISSKTYLTKFEYFSSSLANPSTSVDDAGTFNGDTSGSYTLILRGDSATEYVQNIKEAIEYAQPGKFIVTTASSDVNGLTADHTLVITTTDTATGSYHYGSNAPENLSVATPDTLFHNITSRSFDGDDILPDKTGSWFDTESVWKVANPNQNTLLTTGSDGGTTNTLGSAVSGTLPVSLSGNYVTYGATFASSSLTGSFIYHTGSKGHMFQLKSYVKGKITQQNFISSSNMIFHVSQSGGTGSVHYQLGRRGAITTASAAFRLGLVDEYDDKSFLMSGSGTSKMYFTGSGNKIGFNTTNPTKEMDFRADEFQFQRKAEQKGILITEDGDIESFNKDAGAAATGSEFILSYSPGGTGLVTGSHIHEATAELSPAEWDQQIVTEGIDAVMATFPEDVQSDILLQAENNKGFGVANAGDTIGAIRWIIQSGSNAFRKRKEGEAASITALVNTADSTGVQGDLIFKVADRTNASVQKLLLDADNTHELTGSLHVLNNIESKGNITYGTVGSGHVTLGASDGDILGYETDHSTNKAFMLSNHSAGGKLSLYSSNTLHNLLTYTGDSYVNGTNNANGFVVGGTSTDNKFEVVGTTKLGGHVTASGNISSSANIIGDNVYTDVIRRQSDSSTTTKIKLDDEQIKFFANDANNQTLQIEDGSVDVIGHVTASGHVSASGTISAVTASIAGPIRGKQLQVYHANWKGAASTNETFIPLVGPPDEQTSGTKEQNAMIAPCAGTIREIILRMHWSTSISDPTDDAITWKIYNRPSNKKMNGTTELSNFSMQNPTQGTTDANNTRRQTLSQAFNTGDAIMISMQWTSQGPESSADRIYVTVVVEYDWDSVTY